MSAERIDVVIVGAGLSGIGAACHLQRDCPGTRYAILESRPQLGGTWDLFRYPGIRSDSDMFTLGYGFKPWRDDKTLADGPAILQYLRDTATEHGVDQHIRYGQRVVGLDWSSESGTWTVTTERGDTGERAQLRCRVVLMCAGYYRYEQGHTPELPELPRFAGQVVHPQHWPQDLDYRDKRVVVLGSGATAVTLVPELAKQAAHVVMLQRSPTYMINMPPRDRLAQLLRLLRLPASLAYAIVRYKNRARQQVFYRFSRLWPQRVKQLLLKGVERRLGDEAEVERNFTPHYDPWDERVCAVPDGDLFESVREGHASVVTDHIESMTERGLRLRSGKELDADILVTATGFDLRFMGGAEVCVDGEPVDFGKTFVYRSAMCSGVPNLIFTFGYINASWTLRSDLIAQFSCRLINHLSRSGATKCVPTLRDGDQDMTAQPWLGNFTPGYVQRSESILPKQGNREPWRNVQNYAYDRKRLLRDPIEDDVLQFSRPAQRAPVPLTDRVPEPATD